MASLGKPFAAVVAVFLFTAAGVSAQEAKQYRFAHDRPKSSGYGIRGNIFAEKLKTLGKGAMPIDQYPGSRLGQASQMLQLVKAGDVEFCISSSANAATLLPQASTSPVSSPLPIPISTSSPSNSDRTPRKSRT